jgi:hypothetical protein
VPIAALILKPFEAWLPTPFQYFGLWLLFCFVMQGAMGALVTRVFTSSTLAQVLGALLFVLVPTLLIRVGHPGLTAHFVLLWALWLYLRCDGVASTRVASHLGLGLVAGLTHPYLAAMTLAMLTSLPIRHRTRAAITAWAAAGAATVVAWWLGGFISVSSTSDLSAGGLGLYSMNLLSPITPRGWSTFLPEWPIANEFQAYEGFQYLGAGMLMLLVLAAVTALARRAPSNTAPAWWPLTFVAVLCALYALSPRVTVGDSVLVDWTSPMIDRIAFFRASGRFFWPMTYLLLTASIAAIVSRLRITVAAALLLGAVTLQLFDQQDAHAERRATSRSEAFHTWPRQLRSPLWHEVLPHYKHLLLVPASQCGGAPLEHEELAYLAGLHGLTINSGLGARWDESARRRYCGSLDVELAGGQLRDDALYVVSRAHEERLRSQDAAVACGAIDVARVCVTAASFERWRDRAGAEFQR